MGSALTGAKHGGSRLADAAGQLVQPEEVAPVRAPQVVLGGRGERDDFDVLAAAKLGEDLDIDSIRLARISP